MPEIAEREQSYKEMLAYLKGLAIFKNLRADPFIKALEDLLEKFISYETPVLEVLERWSNLLYEFQQDNPSSSYNQYFFERVINDENSFTLACERGEFDERSLLTALTRTDMKLIKKIAEFNIPILALDIMDLLWEEGFSECAKFTEEGIKSLSDVKEGKKIKGKGIFPFSILENEDLPAFARFIEERGAGIFATRYFFYWKGGILPAANPVKINLEDLSGYEAERKVVLDNTEGFIAGRGGCNILLYGDRGTGKSATIAAVCNKYAAQRLRLLEISKENIKEIPSICAYLSTRRFFFVLFIDDLSFEKQDDSFNELKAILEGGIEQKPANIVLYATSNRRHLVKERNDDRPDTEALLASKESGDRRAFDTMQEQLSLSDRFAVTVIFSSPSQAEYLDIARFIAEREGLFPADGASRSLFFENALKWERWFNGRSPRTARQFIDWLAAGRGFPWE